MRRENDPGSEFEDEGIPDLQAGTPEQQRASDPQQAPIPGEHPIGADDYWVAPDRARHEPHTDRVEREIPDKPAADVDQDSTGRLATPQDEEQASHMHAVDVGADSGGQTAEEQAMHLTEDEPATDEPPDDE